MQHFLYVIESVLAVNLIVLVHEIGHMLAGRMFRVPVLRLSVGLGPRIAGFKRGGTDYYLAPIPLGGFVELQHGHHHGSKSVCMDCLSPWKRAIVYFSGPAANLLLVLVLFWLVYSAIGYRDRDPVVAEVTPGSPARLAGFEPGDRLLEMNGEPVRGWSDVVDSLRRSGGEGSEVVVLRQSRPVGLAGTASGTPVTFTLFAGQWKGLEPGNDPVRFRLGPWEALGKSGEKLWGLSGLLWHSVTGLITTKVAPSELVGPVYLFHISAQTAAESQASLVYLLGMISASLFFFNLIPLPILDGGQIVLAFVQKLLRRPLAPSSMRLLTGASFVWLLAILASATVNDVVRLLWV